MTNICAFCGRTKSDAIADANAVGLRQELQAGIYTCCQIGQWADEQALAWFEAVEQDSKQTEIRVGEPHTREPQPVSVPRLSRPHVPWYRDPNGGA